MNQRDEPESASDMSGDSGARRNRLPILIGLVLAFAIGAFFQDRSSGGDSLPEATLLPAHTTQATYTPYPTLTPRPTYTPLPTLTPLPSHTPYPTLMPLPSHTPYPTSTAMPTYTPYPTLTPRPTYTLYPTATPIEPAALVAEIQDMAQLIVVSVDLVARDFHVGVSMGGCSHGADFYADGAIVSGIDFADIDEDSITYDALNRTYTLRLPAPEITSCRIEYIRQRDASVTLCLVDWDQARLFAEFQVMNDFIEKALEDGILNQAERRSRDVLGDFVRMLTGKKARIEFAEHRQSTDLPASCQPTVPNGWVYDAAANLWREQSD